MPPKFLFDLGSIDLQRVIYDQEAVRRCNPQRGHMEHLNGIIYANPENHDVLGFKDVHADEFWVEGHIPGRPLLPGVLMIEAAAQVASFYTREFLRWTGFIGFGGVENFKFRQQVTPGCRLLILCHQTWQRHKRVCCETQGVVNGTVVFEGNIIGTEF